MTVMMMGMVGVGACSAGKDKGLKTLKGYVYMYIICIHIYICIEEWAVGMLKQLYNVIIYRR